VQDGDTIEVDVENRILHLQVQEDELERRRRVWVAPELPAGGYQRLYCERVMQANLGADFDFLIGTRGHEVPRPSH
jgi:L-arabonate dehydrase